MARNEWRPTYHEPDAPWPLWAWLVVGILFGVWIGLAVFF